MKVMMCNERKGMKTRHRRTLPETGGRPLGDVLVAQSKI